MSVHMNRSTVYHPFVILLMIFLPLSCLHAQDTLTLSRNMLRDGDVLTRTWCADLAGLSSVGRDVCWDLQGVVSSGSSRVRLSRPGESFLYRTTERDTRHYYEQRGDSLLLTGFENNGSAIVFDRPVTVLRFPMVYGDSLSGVYGGSGRCYERQKLYADGAYYSKVDATGMLVLPDGDTLRHVLRLHLAQMERDIIHDINDGGMVSGSDTTYTEKHTFLWYALGYRYPVLRRVYTRQHTHHPVSGVSLAYISPDAQRLLPYDAPNAAKREQLSQEDLLSGAEGPGGVLSYRFSQHGDGDYLTIDYDQLEGGTVEFVLCDTHGIVYRSLSRTESAGEGYSINISYADLTRGQYVLYIRMNSEQYSEKFNVR